MGVSRNNLKVNNSAELLSYVINQTPLLKENIDLPVQGQSIKPIGKLIMDNPAYKNAFLNTMNIIGVTVLTRNHWENPWKKFTDKGRISYGQQVREIIVDIANVYDYNNFVNRPHDFIKTEVPNVLNYIHEVNYQKFYKTSTSDEQMAMAFDREDLFWLIDEIVNSLYEGYEYDSYLANKYMLARRILEGTVTAVQIENIDSKTDRDVVAEIKEYSNNMIFRSPNYNPAGIRKATSFENQFAIVSTKFDAKFTTNVLATSYFRSDAEMKAQMELCDGFGNFDTQRLSEIFGKRDDNGDLIPGEYLDGYIPLTDAELTALQTIPVCLVGIDFFQDRTYGADNMMPGRKTEFFNPQTMRTNHWLHTWGVLSTSPFENAIVFTTNAQAIESVQVSPSTATVTKGQELKLNSVVVADGFANKAVKWGINSVAITAGASIDQNGVLTVPSNYTSTGSGTAGVYTVNIDTILETGDKISINGVEYTVDATSQDTIAKQITALKSAMNTANVTDYFTIGGTSTTMTLTQKSGYYGQVEPIFVFTPATGSDGESSIEVTTAGVIPNNTIVVTATSVYDTSKFGIATITVA